MYFIKTDNEEAKCQLQKEGFQFLHKEGDYYVFLNNKNKETFSQNYKGKIVLTNKIAM